MNSKIDHDNPLTKRAVAWKHKQAIISLSIEEMEKKLGEDTAVIEQKVDGQSVIMDYRDGKAQFATLDGRLIWDIPVLTEIETTLKKNKISQAQMMGELAAMESGKILGFNQSMSIIRNPGSDKNKISWHPYQILNMDGKEVPDDLESYRESWVKIKSLFAGAEHVKPVDYSEGGAGVLKSSWDRLVLKEENEGLVIRTKDGKVWKAKPEFHYDLVIIAVGDKTGKNWPKNRIGTALMAFMDNNGVFRTAGEVSSGFDHKEQAELFSWAQENKVGEDSHYVWVKPSKIMEIQWERTTIKEMKAYSYSKGKYEPKDKMMSGTIVKPRFIRWRTDKSVTPSDLRLTQIPNWKGREKMARKVVSMVINAGSVKDFKTIYMQRAIQDYINNSSIDPKDIDPSRYFIIGLDRHSEYLMGSNTLSKETAIETVSHFKRQPEVRRIIVERPKRGVKEWAKTDSGQWAEPTPKIFKKMMACRVASMFIKRIL